MVKLLMGRGADPNARDKSGKTALELAADPNVRRILATR
jgi:ankyrin repeat protein